MPEGTLHAGEATMTQIAEKQKSAAASTETISPAPMFSHPAPHQNPQPRAVGEEGRRAELAVQGAPSDGDVGLADVGSAQLIPAAAVFGRDGRGGVVLGRRASTSWGLRWYRWLRL